MNECPGHRRLQWAAIVLAAALAVPAVALAAEPGPEPKAADAAPAAAVAVDEKARTVSIPAVVAKQGKYEEVLKGAIEYLVVAQGGRDYETVFTTPATAQQVYDALLKIGLRPGTPPGPDTAGKGPPVNVFAEYEQDGKKVRRAADEFLAYLKDGKPVEPKPWLFTGSSLGFDPETNKNVIQASLTKSIVGLHPHDASPLFLNAREESKQANLYRARTKDVPPAGTQVRLIFERVVQKVAEGTKRVHAFISGRVQGVGFRNFVEGQARKAKVTGFVRNLADGRVEAVVEGPMEAVQAVVEEMKHGPRSARVEKFEVKDEPPAGDFDSFDITTSEGG
jgi:acylphosphatase